MSEAERSKHFHSVSVFIETSRQTNRILEAHSTNCLLQPGVGDG
jgi:hypothetical protein